MHDWRQSLRDLVTIGKSDIFPLLVFEAHPPTDAAWPRNLPASKPIRELFHICDGGFFANYNWLGLSTALPQREQLTLQNFYWHEHLRDYYPNGTSALVKGQHLILGNDASGSPLIWDRNSDHVSTFFFKGGDWEPIAPTFEDFMDDLFFPKRIDGREVEVDGRRPGQRRR